MSRRSPYWQPFTARTPLGYGVAGFISTQPGPAMGTIRFTHVDGPLKRPYTSPPIPAPLPPASLAATLAEAREAGIVEIRALERPDGATIAFYPLYDAEGALVEVVPRTPDTVVVGDTPWRPLAALVQAARHAGMEEAVRRLRAVLVFALEGAENPRLLRHPFPRRLTLVAGLPGTGRARAHHGQLRVWAGQYGLDLPPTLGDLTATPDEAAVLALLPPLSTPIPAPGEWTRSGLQVAISSRAGAELVDLPVDAGSAGSAGPGVVGLWDAMARAADRGLVPTWDLVAADLATRYPTSDPGALQGDLARAWQRWASVYPEAFSAANQLAG